jgi:hypothetical protein
MKLTNEDWGGYGTATLGKQNKLHRIRIEVSWHGIFLDSQIESPQWYYIAEIMSERGASLYGLYHWRTIGEKRRYFDKLFEKLKENQDREASNEIV